jgi:hypothetical protein
MKFKEKGLTPLKPQHTPADARVQGLWAISGDCASGCGTRKCPPKKQERVSCAKFSGGESLVTKSQFGS